MIGSASTFASPALAQTNTYTIEGTVRGLVGDVRVQIDGKKDEVTTTEPHYRITDISKGDHQIHAFEFDGPGNVIEGDGNKESHDTISASSDTIHDITVDNIRYGWVRSGRRLGDPPSVENVKPHIDQYAEYGVTDLFLDVFYQGRTVWPSEYAGMHSDHPDDFLSDIIDYCHSKGMRVHGWFEGTSLWWVSYFGLGDPPDGHILDGEDQLDLGDGKTVTVDESLLAARKDGQQYKEPYNHLFVSPFSDEVADTIENLIREVTGEYDLDGINLDRVQWPESKPEWGFGEASPLTTDMSAEERQRRRVKRIDDLVARFGQATPDDVIYSIATPYAYYHAISQLDGYGSYEKVVRTISQKPSHWVDADTVDWLTPYFYLNPGFGLGTALDWCATAETGNVSVLPGLGVAYDWLASIDDMYDVYNDFDFGGYGVFRASDLKGDLP